MPSNHPDSVAQTMRQIFQQTRSIAVVGLSPKPHRDSFSVSASMQRHGFRIVPVNPNATQILGEPAYATLAAAAAAQTQAIDLVNCFRNSADIPPIVDQAIAIGAKAIWLQLGIVHEEAAAKAEAAGLLVVQNRCIMVEYARLSAQGGL
ncbi:CoA-binding protein [Variovorax sp. HJSM1_2]|uniref:CoA-binding protein n=1 Tax=Variovorax sp. HJSM1_2 TaxID=3366263 RepID=UPI003BBA362B